MERMTSSDGVSWGTLKSSRHTGRGSVLTLDSRGSAADPENGDHISRLFRKLTAVYYMKALITLHHRRG